MTTACRAVPKIALVVRCPKGSSAALARELGGRIEGARLRTTWAVEEPHQGEAIAAALGSDPPEIAMLAQASGGFDADQADRRLAAFRGAGHRIQTIALGGRWQRGLHERRLRQDGIRAIVSRAHSRPPVSPLPFGLWHFAPDFEAPAAGGWSRLFSRAPRAPIFDERTAATVVGIDMARLGAPGSRAWNEAAAVVDRIAGACRGGAFSAVTLAVLAGELARDVPSRPQRSILRAA
jgi:hypothetical protein